MLHVAALALLAALGLAAGGTLNDEQRRRRKKSIEDAGTGPASKTAPDVGTKTTTETGTQTRTRSSCKQCPPDCGKQVPRNWHMNDGPREYQARITGFPPGQEWEFLGVDFDGFKSAECLLLEAKGNYDQFLVIEPGMPPRPVIWYKSFDKMRRQVVSHWKVVSASPPARCHWHFQTLNTFEYMQPHILLHPPLQAYFSP